ERSRTLVAPGLAPVEDDRGRRRAELHGGAHLQRGQGNREARLVREDAHRVSLPPVLHQGDVGMGARRRSRGAHRVGSSSEVSTARPARSSVPAAGAFRNRATTAPPSPPAPVSFAPSAPARRSVPPAEAGAGELTPAAARSPWLTFIASPSDSRSPSSRAAVPSTARRPISLNSRP